MRDTIKARAAAYGLTFKDTIPPFVGHAVCDSTEWLNGLSNPTGESYHPNRTGHSSGYLPLARAGPRLAANGDGAARRAAPSVVCAPGVRSWGTSAAAA